MKMVVGGILVLGLAAGGIYLATRDNQSSKTGDEVVDNNDPKKLKNPIITEPETKSNEGKKDPKKPDTGKPNTGTPDPVKPKPKPKPPDPVPSLETTAEFVALPLYDGEIGILPGRAPLIGRLGYGELRTRGERPPNGFSSMAVLPRSGGTWSRC